MRIPCRSLLLLFVLTATCALAQDKSVEFQKLVLRVQQVPASTLDRSLPDVGLLKWLRSVAGSNALIGWAVRDSKDTDAGFPWVEVEVAVDGQGVRNHPQVCILIAYAATSDRPKVQSVQLVSGQKPQEWRRLRDFPAALHEAAGLAK
jgi:hypothetical protein